MTDAPALVQLDASQRREALREYSVEMIDNGSELVCAFARRCQASAAGRGNFVPGQLSHVGSNYDLHVEGRPLRILVVGTQTGRDDEHVTMDARTEQIESAKPVEARKFPRTPHMDGTALGLKVLLGMDPEGDDEIEPGVHVFDCFAMVNATHCVVVDGKAAGTGTRDMFELCTRHLRKTIALLQPTVVVAQGWHKTGESPMSSVTRALGMPKMARGSVSSVAKDWGSVTVAALANPTRQWPTAQHDVFRNEVLPALTRARDIAVG